MFKKIHSNRDPRDTLVSEVRKEFRPYFKRAGDGLRTAAGRHPKFLFGLMVVNLFLSAILCFTTSRHKEVIRKATPVKLATPVSDGFDRIIEAGASLRQTIRLKREVDSITKKKTLDRADSAQLLIDLDSLQHIRKTINH